MSLPYDEEIFKRGQFGGFVLSQRFKHICYRFRGTFTAAAQIISTNVVLRALPRSIAYSLFYCFIFLILLLCCLIISEWIDKKNCKYTDCDMTDAIRSRKKVLDWIGGEGVLLIIIFISVASTVRVILIERMNTSTGLWYGLLIFFILIVLARFSLKPPIWCRLSKTIIERCFIV